MSADAVYLVAGLALFVGVLAPVRSAPVTVSLPVTSARWHSAESSAKSAVPLDGDTPKAQDFAPPTESL